MPGAAAVARVLNLVAWHELLAVAQPEAALSLDGRDDVRPVEFHLDPFLAKVPWMHWIRWTPGAASDVQIESVCCCCFFCVVFTSTACAVDLQVVGIFMKFISV